VARLTPLTTKICKQCSESKTPEMFYKKNKVRCKDCVRARAIANRAANIEHYRKQRTTPERRAQQQAYRRKDRDQIKARSIVQHAIEAGKLTIQPCEQCGIDKNIHAHHEDYKKPLSVVWLCPKCHGKRHREINEQNASNDPGERLHASGEVMCSSLK